jgi:hypothetical protein
MAPRSLFEGSVRRDAPLFTILENTAEGTECRAMRGTALLYL